jgi:hypothetical protein
MPIFHQIFGRVRKGHVGIQIAPLLAESFDPTICRKAVIVAGMADYEGCLMYRRVIVINYLLKVLVREVSLNTLGRRLISRLEYVNLFGKHLVI